MHSPHPSDNGASVPKSLCHVVTQTLSGSHHYDCLFIHNKSIFLSEAKVGRKLPEMPIPARTTCRGKGLWGKMGARDNLCLYPRTALPQGGNNMRPLVEAHYVYENQHGNAFSHFTGTLLRYIFPSMISIRWEAFMLRATPRPILYE